MNEKEICFENVIGAIRGIPVIENDLIGENTVVLINKKTGAGKIIEYEVRIQQLEKENEALKERVKLLELDNESMSNKMFKQTQEISDLKAINESLQTDIGLYLNSIKELQDKLSKIKYLERKKVIKIVSHAIMIENFKTNSDLITYFVNAICSLAIPVIDKDRVIFEELHGTNYYSDNFILSLNKLITVKQLNTIKKLINEILNNKE